MSSLPATRSSALTSALFILLLTSIFLTGCDVGSPEYQAIDAPPLNLVDVTLTGVDAMGNPTTVTLTPANPALGSSDPVHVTSSVRLRFDRFLLPGEAIRQAICLQPSADPVATINECTKSVFLEPAYDPVRRTVTYRLPLLADPLTPDTKYWLTVFAPTKDSPFGFSAFDGASLQKNIVLQFTTAVTNPGGPVDPPLDDAGKRSASEELFCVASKCVAECTDDACKSKCAISKSLVNGCSFCHGRLEAGAAVMGLDLSGPERLSAMIGRVANQTQTGGDADEPDAKPRRFGRAMPHVDPGNAGNSYLLYKMLVSPIYERSSAAAGLAPGEIDRLRASVVVGLPMPPYEFSALADPGVDALSAWITTGAQTPVCP